MQAWPGSNLGPPNEFVECQPVGFRGTGSWFGFICQSAASRFVWNSSCQGGRGQTPYPEGQFISHMKCPSPLLVGVICHWDDSSQTHVVHGRPVVSRFEWPGVWELVVLNSFLVPLAIYAWKNPKTLKVMTTFGVVAALIRHFRCHNLIV